VNIVKISRKENLMSLSASVVVLRCSLCPSQCMTFDSIHM
jgi:hypothetical protein